MIHFDSSRPTSGSNPYLLGLFSVVLVVFGSLIVYSTSKNNSSTSSLLNMSVATPSEFVVTFGRVNYEPLPYFDNSRSMITKYKHLEKYLGILEPHSDMELQLYDTSLLTGYEYSFKVCKEGDSSQCQEGSKDSSSSSSINFRCSAYDVFDVEVTQIDVVTKKTVGKVSGQALCLYVRRELRDITVSDLEKFTAAAFTLTTTNDNDGKAKYGDKFSSDATLLRFHHFNAAQQDSDHIHEGNGFLTQHLKFTNIYETSLQSVDPSVVLPYWDFTIDDSEKHSVSNSILINENLYGAMHSPKDIMKGMTYQDDRIEDGIIKTGRWASLKAEMNTQYDDLKYGYGYMRAPWSMNPSPYVSRFTSVFNQQIMLPSCDMHVNVLQNYDDMMDFFNAMAYEPHATIHTLTGGIYGCDKLLPLVEAGYINTESGAYSICKGWTFNLKEWYRKNYITPRKNCVVNTEKLEDSVCGFDCVEENKDLLTSFIFNSVGKYGDVNKEGAEQAWLDFVCNGGPGGQIFPGDHLESASPADPSFWVIHPTLERLFQAKLMAGGFKTENWHTDPLKEYVCNKAKCYKPEKGYSDYFGDCCYGHFENDRLLDAVNGDSKSYIGPTNAEVIKGTDPRTSDYSMPYIYDKFEWNHCETSFDGVLTAMLKKSTESPVVVEQPAGGVPPAVPVGPNSGNPKLPSHSS